MRRAHVEITVGPVKVLVAPGALRVAGVVDGLPRVDMTRPQSAQLAAILDGAGAPDDPDRYPARPGDFLVTAGPSTRMKRLAR